MKKNTEKNCAGLPLKEGDIIRPMWPSQFKGKEELIVHAVKVRDIGNLKDVQLVQFEEDDRYHWTGLFLAVKVHVLENPRFKIKG